MPEFMVMIMANEAKDARLAPTVTKGLVEGHSAYERALRAAAAYLDGERLRPSDEGRRVSAHGVQPGPFGDPALAGYYLVKAAPGRGRHVTPTAVFDGPFLESKEVIGGVFFMRMATIEEAVQWARESEFVQHGAVEIRELWRS